MTCRIAYSAVDMICPTLKAPVVLILGQDDQDLQHPFILQCGAELRLSIARLYRAFQIRLLD